MKSSQLRSRTAADIDSQVAKVLRGLGNPEPPLELRLVRELLKLDRSFYNTTDDSLLRETVSRLKVAGRQILKRPTILRDAISASSLKALYLPDQKRILLDESLPPLKHRWNEAHEVGHDIIPWHDGMMLGDTEHTLTMMCHAQMENEANYAAGRMLFLGDRFIAEANASTPSLKHVRQLSKAFGNTITSTLWRYVAQTHIATPLVAIVSGHPHLTKRHNGFDPLQPCRYCVESVAFKQGFGSLTEIDLFGVIVGYCGAQRGGMLGEDDVMLPGSDGNAHIFHFETFFNGHEALTLGVWLRRHATRLKVTS